MLRLYTLLAISSLLLAQSSSSNDERIAISLSYDDALESQLDYAIPSLDKYHLKASFYLVITHPSVTTRLEEWRQAANNGHELGNHTLFHPCRASKNSRDWIEDHRDLDRYSMERITEEIKAANTFLHAIDGKTERTYTPTCLDKMVDGENYLDVIKPMFAGIKTYGYNQYDEAFGNNDGHSVIFMPEGQSAEDLIKYVEQASKQFKEINILFHGIGGDYLIVAAKEHELFLKYLYENQDRYYIDTYLNISKKKANSKN